VNDINVPLLRKALEDVTAHPEEWNQGGWAVRLLQGKDGAPLSVSKSRLVWVTEVELAGSAQPTQCGTACCLAGNVAIKQLGGKPLFEEGYFNTGKVELNGVKQFIRDAAQQHLGLMPNQADELFRSDNTLYRLWGLANQFTDGEIEIPVQFG